MSNKIYIAGPMTGIPHFNFPKFDEIAASFRAKGFFVFSPADNDRELLGKPKNWIPEEEDSTPGWKSWKMENAPGLQKMLGDDLNWIAQNATHIYMIEGWENSRGAFAEWSLARALDLVIYYE